MILDKADYHDAGVELEDGDCDSNTHMICFLVWASKSNNLKNPDLSAELAKDGRDIQALNGNGWFDQVDASDLAMEARKAEKMYKAYLEEYGKAITKIGNVFYVDYSEESQSIADDILNRLVEKYK
jgi:hypothetical protein